jgi:2-dehydropantoate 2-reductase
MDALSVSVVDLPGTPVRMLAFLMRSLPLRLSQLIARRTLAAGRGGKMPSFHIDLHQGRGNVEVDYLNGAVVRFGTQLGITTPVNRFFNDTLLRLSRGELLVETYRHQPQRLLADISSRSP